MDPFTRVIFWLFADGSWESTVPSGPMSEGKKRWAQTVAQANQARRRNARLFAQMDIGEPEIEEVIVDVEEGEPPF